MNSFTIKPKIIVHIIALLAVLLLMGTTAWAFFWKEKPLEIAGPAIIIISIIGGIGSVIIFFVLKIIITRPAVITIDENGFEYNPGGVSSGWVTWSNVAEIKEVEVRTQKGVMNGPFMETTLAIKLKDPDLYRNRFNPIIRGLMKLNDKMYDADIFFRISNFGKEADTVKMLMMQYWKAQR